MMTMRSSLTDVVGEKHDFLIMMLGAVCEWEAAFIPMVRCQKARAWRSADEGLTLNGLHKGMHGECGIGSREPDNESISSICS